MKSIRSSATRQENTWIEIKFLAVIGVLLSLFLVTRTSQMPSSSVSGVYDTPTPIPPTDTPTSIPVSTNTPTPTPTPASCANVTQQCTTNSDCCAGLLCGNTSAPLVCYQPCQPGSVICANNLEFACVNNSQGPYAISNCSDAVCNLPPKGFWCKFTATPTPTP